jgi:hypothetical protein
VRDDLGDRLTTHSQRDPLAGLHGIEHLRGPAAQGLTPIPMCDSAALGC